MTELLHADLTYKLRGIAFHIHNELRGGHAECVYETALAYALEDAAIPFQQQPVYRVTYREQQVGEYRPDLMLSDNALLVELKATPVIEALHKAQTISYLAVTQADLGLIMNFGASSMQFERIPNFLGQRQMEENLAPAPVSDDLLYPELSARVLDALFHVHRILGAGFLHQVYRRATRIELAHRYIGCTYLKELPLRYNRRLIAMKPTRLFHIEHKMLLATVALKTITSTETERLRWAMNMTHARLGLIANFHGTRLELRFLRNP